MTGAERRSPHDSSQVVIRRGAAAAREAGSADLRISIAPTTRRPMATARRSLVISAGETGYSLGCILRGMKLADLSRRNCSLNGLIVPLRQAAPPFGK